MKITQMAQGYSSLLVSPDELKDLRAAVYAASKIAERNWKMYPHNETLRDMARDFDVLLGTFGSDGYGPVCECELCECEFPDCDLHHKATPGFKCAACAKPKRVYEGPDIPGGREEA